MENVHLKDWNLHATARIVGCKMRWIIFHTSFGLLADNLFSMNALFTFFITFFNWLQTDRNLLQLSSLGIDVDVLRSSVVLVN